MRFGPLAVLTAAIACGTAPDAVRDTARPAVPESRELGSWSGAGNSTLGFVSESGSFRITWKTKNKDDARPGAFQLTLRSGISGRPDEGDCRPSRVRAAAAPSSATTHGLYEFLVESSGVDWSVSVQETFAPRQ